MRLLEIVFTAQCPDVSLSSLTGTTDLLDIFSDPLELQVSYAWISLLLVLRQGYSYTLSQYSLHQEVQLRSVLEEENSLVYCGDPELHGA